MTDEVEAKLKKLRDENKDNRESTALYSNILTMKEYGLTPHEWKQLSRIDKKILNYARVMETYYIEYSPDRIDMRKQAKESKLKARQQSLVAKMPQTLPRQRRR